MVSTKWDAKDWILWHKTGWRRRIGMPRLMALVPPLAFNFQSEKKWRSAYLIFIVALVLCVFRCTMSLTKLLPVPTNPTTHRFRHQCVRFPLAVMNYIEPQSSGMRLILGEEQNAAIRSSSSSPTTESPSFLEEARSHGEAFICDRSSYRTDVCILKGDVRTHASSSTIFLVSSDNTSDEQTIRPYTRKWENDTMSSVDELSLKRIARSSVPPACQVNHSVPALVFSTGGYTGNLFHDFTDVIVPLFITSRHLKGQTLFVIPNYKQWWMDKFGEILGQLSYYRPLDFRQDSRVHCFPEAIVGLRFHADLSIDPTAVPNGYTMEDFQNLLRKAYTDDNGDGDESRGMYLRENTNRTPKLVIVAREGCRVLVNQGEIVRTATKLGFNVVVLKPDRDSILKQMYEIINSCDVLMGVHGAALTHFLFLRPGAVFIQIVPLGIEWASRTFFREPAMKMKNIHYLEYQILPEESSLYEEYPKDHPILRNPKSVNDKGWEETKRVYLDTQNVKMDKLRLQKVLRRSLHLVRPNRNNNVR